MRVFVQKHILIWPLVAGWFSCQNLPKDGQGFAPRPANEKARMFRTALTIGLVANAGLFCAGLWRSILQGSASFHSLGELFPGLSGPMAALWVWPLTLIVNCGLLSFALRQKHPSQPAKRP